MLKIYYYIIFTFCTVAYCNAQVGNVWHFGHTAGLDFNSVNGAIAPTVNSNSIMISDEGCASVSDENGTLLFYTNGRKVFTTLHQLMKNGDSLNGNVSSFQSSLIIAHPGNKNLYYLFTSDAIENNFANGYQYHIIDITADNNKGEVISKNNLLFGSGTERLTAIQHSNGNDIWVITNDKFSNTFRSWLVNCSGLQTTPVVSNSGIILNSFGEMNIGALVASPDGKKICQTHFQESDILNLTHYIQLFDFNASTGVISNAQKIELSNKIMNAAAFSPDSKLLYLSGNTQKFLCQLDISLPTPAAIITSLDTIPGEYGLYGLQMGPDEKIYATRYGRSIGVIHSPNQKGILCNFADTSIQTNGALAQLNLPNFINNIFADPYSNFTYSFIDSCTGIVQFNGFTNIAGTVSYAWNFGDGNFSTLANPVHTYTNLNRLYTVKLKITSSANCAPIYRSHIIAPRGILLKPDFDFTLKCDSGLVYFSNKTITFPFLNNYAWDFGDNTSSSLVNPVHQYTTLSNYTVVLKILGVNSCLQNSISKTIPYNVIQIQAPPDFTINENESAVLNTITNSTQILWSPATYMNNPALVSPTVTPLQDITYIVTAKNEANCFAKDTVTIKVNPIKEIYIPTVFSPNGDGKNDHFYPTFSRTIQQINFTVYNRWGQEVFRGTPQNNFTWNGISKNKPVTTGTYVWKFSAILSNGVPIKKTGTLLVLK